MSTLSVASVTALDSNTNLSLTTANGSLVIANNGNVGIGNNAPSHRLRVEGTLSLSSGLHANGSLGTAGQALVSNGSGVYWGVGVDIATAANLRAGTSNKLVDAAVVYSASAPVTSSGSGNHSFDFNAGRVFQRTLTGNTTLTNPTNQTAGQSGIVYIIQDATGGRTLTLGSDWKPLNGAPAIDTSPNKVNVFSYYVRAQNSISLSYLGTE